MKSQEDFRDSPLCPGWGGTSLPINRERKIRLGLSGGFTLMELMFVVAIMAMISVVVTAMFFRAIRGSSKTETTVVVEQSAQLSLAVMDRFVRNAKEVVSVGGVECPATGTTLTLLSWDGGTTTFSLTAEGRIASNGGEMSESIILVENLSFECFRQGGIPDQINISFDATRDDVGGGSNTSGHYEGVVGLRNY